MVNTRAKCLIFALVILLQSTAFAGNDGSSHQYSTGIVMELDRCASAWLIQRYIDTQASFRFLAEEELMVTTDRSFDTSFSEFRRTHTQSTFEVIRQKYVINDNKVKHLALLIHDIEINFWNKELGENASRFKREIEKLIQSAVDNDAALQSCFNYLDNLTIEN